MPKFAKLTLAMLLVAVVGPKTQASFVPVMISPPVGGTGTAFTYSLNFNSDGSTETLTSGSFITLYDFDAGVTSPSQISAPAGITATVQATGITPGILAGVPTDSPTINNIIFTYTGATLTSDTTFAVTINTVGGPYTTRFGQYTSTDTIIQSPIRTNNQLGGVFLPTATATVPEPASLAMMSLGVIGLGALSRARRKS